MFLKVHWIVADSSSQRRRSFTFLLVAFAQGFVELLD